MSASTDPHADTTSTPALPSGIDLQWVDSDVRMQDDLYSHVNGTWLRDHTIPDDRSIDGSFLVLRDRAEEDVRDIVTACADSSPAPGSDAARIGDLYAAFMDIDTIDALGISPLQPRLDTLAAINSRAALIRAMGTAQRDGAHGVIEFYVDTDAKQSDRYLVHLTQSGLGLPDESYYREDKHAQTLAAYRAHVAKMFALARVDDPTSATADVIELETALASHHWDVVRRRDADLTYNLHTIDELRSTAGNFEIDEWLQGLGVDDSSRFAEVIVGQPSFISGVNSLLETAPLSQWVHWLQWHVIHAAAPYLSSEFVNENFDFYGRTLSGTPQIRERWKRGVALTEGAVGFAIGKFYVDQHFPPAAKGRMDDLIANLIAAYRVNISQLDWMSPATRDKALDKLAKFTPKIGYPTTWRDYTGLDISRIDLLGNVARAHAFEQDRELSKIGQPVDRDEWFMTPQTVNAYYNPGMNEIVFPAAILQPPFFDPDADDAANYGGIGAVIGHEIGHGFDDQGAKYDGDGNLADWWTDSDRIEFGKRTKHLIDQYSQYTPRGLDPSHTVNGDFTIGENIGDLGGLSISLAAYAIATHDTPAPDIDGLTGLQRVFFGWAQVWRTKTREAEAIQRLSIDPHSPPEFRCNGVIRNIDAFYDAFNVVDTDALYLPPAERVHIW